MRDSCTGAQPVLVKKKKKTPNLLLNPSTAEAERPTLRDAAFMLQVVPHCIHRLLSKTNGVSCRQQHVSTLTACAWSHTDGHAVPRRQRMDAFIQRFYMDAFICPQGKGRCPVDKLW